MSSSAMQKALDLILPGADDTRREAMAWLASLAKERRLSAKTVEAYARDLRQFLAFLTNHLGEPPSVKAILGLKPMDIRAFLAARRMDSVGSRSLMRQLAALRSFARHLEREGFGTASAFAAIRTPKVDKNLPRPLSASSAIAVTDAQTRASENRKPWILARDAAVLSLLYGAGLRISEALGLQRRDAPVQGIDMVTVTGKGGKMRSVPVIPAIQRAVGSICNSAPMRSRPKGRFSSARAAGRSRPASFSLPWKSCAVRWACPTAPRPMPCATPSRRISSPKAATCAASRSSWAMPRSRRRSFTRRSTRPG
jgi:integrase/recombinase XerC